MSTSDRTRISTLFISRLSLATSVSIWLSMAKPFYLNLNMYIILAENARKPLWESPIFRPLSSRVALSSNTCLSRLVNRRFLSLLLMNDAVRDVRLAFYIMSSKFGYVGGISWPSMSITPTYICILKADLQSCSTCLVLKGSGKKTNALFGH